MFLWVKHADRRVEIGGRRGANENFAFLISPWPYQLVQRDIFWGSKSLEKKKLNCHSLRKSQ